MVFASLKKIFTAQRNKLTGFHVEFATCGCTQDVPKSHGSKIQLSSPVHTVHNINLILSLGVIVIANLARVRGLTSGRRSGAMRDYAWARTCCAASLAEPRLLGRGEGLGNCLYVTSCTLQL